MADPASLQPGDPQRLGAYALLGRLGDGGQGVVYLGRGPDGREVAVKLLHARFGADAEARARFGRELALIQRVAGFCTAQVLAADVSGDRPYIVSEYVTGPSLEQLVRERGPRTGTDLDRLAIGTATALTAIHRAGIVHRDFKPANVLMAQDGPRVIDFGIARALDSGATMASGVVGTPAFMAPEQVAGAQVDKPVDIFAWGATMAYAATGGSPFGHDTVPAVFNRILNQRPDLTRLPAHLRVIVEACLEKDPAGRPTAQQLLLRLLGEEADSGQALAQGRSRAQQQGWASPAAQTPLPPPQVPAPPPMHAPAPPPMHAHPAPPAHRPPYQGPGTIPSGPPAPRRRTGLVVAAAAGAVVLLAGGGTAAWLLTGEGKSSDATAAQTDDPVDPPEPARRLQGEAGPLVASVLDFDHRTIDADIARASERMTQRAQARYSTNFSTIKREITAKRNTVRTTVVDSAVLASSPDRVSMLVFERRVTTSARPTTTLPEIVRYTQVRQPDGRWLIDDFDSAVPELRPWTYPGAAWPGRAAGGVLSAARECLGRVHTYDYRTFAQDVRELAECSTGDYRAQVLANQPKTTAETTRRRVVAEAALLEAGVKPGARADQATVLATMVVNVTSDTGGRTGRFVYGFWADMRLTGGRWMLAKLDQFQ
ncbi:serine/threonine-protein kinase [Spirillospora sp. NPDC127200]